MNHISNRENAENKNLWFFLSLIVSASLALLGLRLAFVSQYVIQNDARQYIPVLYRMVDPSLFPGDVIVEYYDSISPPGFKAFYKAAAAIGIDPPILNKLVPLPLVLIATIYCFALVMELHPAPAAAFLASVLLNENIWTKEDISSGTPRSFVFPLFFPFAYYLARRSWIACILLVALQALFFPPVALISLCLLGYYAIRDLSGRQRVIVILSAFVCCALIFGVYAMQADQFGPVTQLNEARNNPGLTPGTAQPFFYPDFWNYWIRGYHGGLFPYGMHPPLLWAGALLPFILLLFRKSDLSFASAKKLWILPAILAVSIAWFFLAHLLLFFLYNPGRYTQHTLPVVLSVASGIALWLLLLIAYTWKRWLGFLAAGAICFLLAFHYINVTKHGYGFATYVRGTNVPLYDFFASQPLDIMIASTSREVDNIPAFSRRSILVGREYALPYHQGYWNDFYTRGQDLLRAQYGSDLTGIERLVAKYKVEYVMFDKNAFDAVYFRENPWLKAFEPVTGQVVADLKRGNVPAVIDLIDQCKVFENRGIAVVATDCLLAVEEREQWANKRRW